MECYFLGSLCFSSLMHFLVTSSKRMWNAVTLHKGSDPFLGHRASGPRIFTTPRISHERWTANFHSTPRHVSNCSSENRPSACEKLTHRPPLPPTGRCVIIENLFRHKTSFLLISMLPCVYLQVKLQSIRKFWS